MAAGLTVRGIELDPSGTLRVLVGKSGKDKPDAHAFDGELQD
jgi:hypothetical protein